MKYTEDYPLGCDKTRMEYARQVIDDIKEARENYKDNNYALSCNVNAIRQFDINDPERHINSRDSIAELPIWTLRTLAQKCNIQKVRSVSKIFLVNAIADFYGVN